MTVQTKIDRKSWWYWINHNFKLVCKLRFMKNTWKAGSQLSSQNKALTVVMSLMSHDSAEKKVMSENKICPTLTSVIILITVAINVAHCIVILARHPPPENYVTLISNEFFFLSFKWMLLRHYWKPFSRDSIGSAVKSKARWKVTSMG